ACRMLPSLPRGPRAIRTGSAARRCWRSSQRRGAMRSAAARRPAPPPCNGRGRSPVRYRIDLLRLTGRLEVLGLFGSAFLLELAAPGDDIPRGPAGSQIDLHILPGLVAARGGAGPAPQFDQRVARFEPLDIAQLLGDVLGADHADAIDDVFERDGPFLAALGLGADSGAEVGLRAREAGEQRLSGADRRAGAAD